jgi:hypothetical protein
MVYGLRVKGRKESCFRLARHRSIRAKESLFRFQLEGRVGRERELEKTRVVLQQKTIRWQ